MVSKRKFTKRILSVIIIFIVSFLIVSLTATKFIYDGIFKRYDCPYHEYDPLSDKFTLNHQNLNFYSGKNKLAGKLFKGDKNADTLVVFAPGFNSCSENYLFQITGLLDGGFAVFTFDATGHCASEGRSAKGFAQELLDLNAAINFIENKKRFGYNNIALVGYSMGGYAACCALAENKNISAVVSIAGINSAMEGVMSGAVRSVGSFVYANWGGLWLYQSMLFGAETVNLRADKILSQSAVPTLIIQGEDDETVPMNRFSIYSHKEEIKSSNVEFVLRQDPANDGHTDILFEDSSANGELMKIINDFLTEKVK